MVNKLKSLENTETLNLQEERNDENIIQLAELEKDCEGPACDENMEESADEFEHQ